MKRARVVRSDIWPRYQRAGSSRSPAESTTSSRSPPPGSSMTAPTTSTTIRTGNPTLHRAWPARSISPSGSSTTTRLISRPDRAGGTWAGCPPLCV